MRLLRRVEHIDNHGIVKAGDKAECHQARVHGCAHAKGTLGWVAKDVLILLNIDTNFRQRIQVGTIKGQEFGRVDLGRPAGTYQAVVEENGHLGYGITTGENDRHDEIFAGVIVRFAQGNLGTLCGERSKKG